MTWKKGTVTFDDGSSYPAELFIKNNGKLSNMRIEKQDGTIVQEFSSQYLAEHLNKNPEDIYPYNYEVKSME